jgi:hypothetical protein
MRWLAPSLLLSVLGAVAPDARAPSAAPSADGPARSPVEAVTPSPSRPTRDPAGAPPAGWALALCGVAVATVIARRKAAAADADDEMLATGPIGTETPRGHGAIHPGPRTG